MNKNPDYDGVFISLNTAIANKTNTFIYDFGAGASYEKINQIVHQIQAMSYIVRYQNENRIQVWLRNPPKSYDYQKI